MIPLDGKCWSSIKDLDMLKYVVLLVLGLTMLAPLQRWVPTQGEDRTVARIFPARKRNCQLARNSAVERRFATASPPAKKLTAARRNGFPSSKKVNSCRAS